MKWKPSSPSSAKGGFTIIELLVSAAITLMLLGLAFNLVLSNQKVYRLDKARTVTNQNLRAALDLIAADIRQAGERLPDTFPAIKVKNGKHLYVRKNLNDTVLPVCEDINENDTKTTITVSSTETEPAVCTIVDDDNNTYDDRQEAWREYRCQQDGTSGCGGDGRDLEQVKAYIFSSALNEGEWFTYKGDDLPDHQIEILSKTFSKNYAKGISSLYLLEEHHYKVNENNVLVLSTNNDSDNTIKLIDNVEEFQVTVKVSGDDNEKKDFNVGGVENSWHPWTKIEAINVTITVKESSGKHTVTRTISGSYFPRNVLSH